jgi:hypothetical protein
MSEPAAITVASADSASPDRSNVSAMNSPADGRFVLARDLVKRRGLFATSRRKLVAALIASIVAHLVTGLLVDAEPPEEKIQPLAARLMPLPPPPVAEVTPPAPKPKPKPKRKPTPRPVVAESAPVAIAAPEPVVEAAPAPTPAVAEAPPAPPPEIVPPPVPEPPPPAPPPARMPPKKIELGYAAFLGEQKFEVGPVNLTFTHDAGRYKLTVKGRGRGLAALLYPGTFTGESEGRITADGLRPDKFIEERGNPDKRRETIFDHEKGLLRIPDKDPIPFEGAPHDPLTWIVQFYFAMPKGDNFTLSVGTSRRMDVYTLEKTGEEVIDAPIGALDPLSGKRALEKVKTELWKGTRKPDADGKPNGSAQFWLAPGWNYVPFRIKLVNAQGRSASLDLTASFAE